MQDMNMWAEQLKEIIRRAPQHIKLQPLEPEIKRLCYNLAFKEDQG